MGLFSSDFDDRVDDATSEMIPNAQSDLAKNMDICDVIRSRNVSARDAVRSLKRRLLNANPNVQLLALGLVDSCVKNTNMDFLREFASRDFVDALVGVCLSAGLIRDRVCEYVSNWVRLTKDIEELKYLEAAVLEAERTHHVKIMTALSRDHQTASMDALASSLIATETVTAPEWTDSAACERCRVGFGLLQRKHHCRSCGRTFCQQCSEREMALPEFGMTEPVRVCQTCYDERSSKQKRTIPKPPSPVHVAPSSAVASSIQAASSTNASYDEEAALAAAIAASLQETTGASSIPSASTAPVSSMSSHPQQQQYSQQLQQQQYPQQQTDSRREIEQAVSSPDQTALMISPVERECVRLFSQVVQRLSPSDVSSDEEMTRMAGDLDRLRLKLSTALADGSVQSSLEASDLARVVSLIDDALCRYRQLCSRAALLSSGKTLPEPLISAKIDHQPTSNLSFDVSSNEQSTVSTATSSCPDTADSFSTEITSSTDGSKQNKEQEEEVLLIEF